MKTYNSIKRIILFVVTFFMSLWSFAQTQYDYYEGKDAYGGVDTAIKGLKIVGIILLAIAVIVIVGGLWAKVMDFINPPKNNPSQNKPTQTTINPKKELQTIELENKPIENKRAVVITIIGKYIEVDVTKEDGSKTKEWFWYKIKSIILNLSQDITHEIGEDVVKPISHLVYKGCTINNDDINPQTIEDYKYSNRLLTIHGIFDPNKLQLVRVEGFDLYDTFMYYYDGDCLKQLLISEKEADTIVQNAL